MVKKLKQYRYYNENGNSNVEKNKLKDGTAFQEVYPIVQLGVQSLPGTTFYVNNSPDPVVVGTTGVFELDLRDGVVITNLRFGDETFNLIDSNNTGYLIIDIMYEED